MENQTNERTLFQVATGTELSNSVGMAFNELICSAKFTELERKDRERILFHLELLRDFLNNKN